MASRYQILQPLGEGGMGTVYLARDAIRQELVALKRMQRVTPDRRVRFKAEFRGIADLEHPNLVRLFELGEDEEGLFFTMEWIRGVTYDRFCESGVDPAPGPQDVRPLTWTDPASDPPGAAPSDPETRSAGAEPCSPQAARRTAPTEDGLSVPPTLPPEPTAPTVALESAPTLAVHETDLSTAHTGAGIGKRDAARDPQHAASTPAAPPAGPHTQPRHRPKAAPPTAPGESEARLLQRIDITLPQILAALDYLHRCGVVHRDLKPANILVTPDSRVKLLDFGLLGRTVSEAQPARPAAALGTVGFMAPEQLRGAAPHPAMDLYALGALLYEILAGRPVFPERGIAAVAAHLTEPPLPLDGLAPWAPSALTDAVMALLDKDPRGRPSAATLLRTLFSPGRAAAAAASPSPPKSAAHPEGHLIGRAALEKELLARLAPEGDTAFRFQVLQGPAGVGKSSLAKRVAQHLQAAGWLVLRGRGRANERVAFNVLDGAIDDLAGRLQPLLGTLPEGAQVRQALRLAATAFPVLDIHPETAPPGAVTRAAVFQAVADLLQALGAATGGVLLFLDDFHWADGDSLALLDHLTGAAPSGVALLATLRTDVAHGPAADWLSRVPRVDRVPVPALSPEATCALVARTAGVRLAGLTPAHRDRIVAECQGNPMLAEVLGRRLAARGLEALSRSGGLSLADTVSAQLADLPSLGREVLAALLAADAWVDVRDLATLLARRYGELEDVLTALGRAALVRTRGGTGIDGRIDLYHDAVRNALAAALPEPSVARAHAAWADLLLQQDAPRPERLVRHLVAAGRRAEARRWARQAAERAEGQGAFGLAADLYGLLLEDTPATGWDPAPHDPSPEAPGALSPDWQIDLRARQARCYQRAGRFAEAAAAWEAIQVVLHREAPSGQALAEAMLGKAEALLAANDVAAGHRALEAYLRAAGEPPLAGSRAASALAGLRFLLGPRWGAGLRLLQRGGRRDAPMDAPAAERATRTVSLVTHFDVLQGVRLLQRAQDRMIASDLWEQAASCDYILAFVALFGEPRAGRIRLATQYLRAAEERLAGRAPRDPMLRSMPRFMEGALAQHRGQWAEAAAAFDAVMASLRDAGLLGTYEYSRAVYHRCIMAACLQDLPTLGALLAHWRSVAQRSRRVATHANRTVLEVLWEILSGRPRAALARVDEAIQVYPEHLLHLQHRSLRLLRWLPRIYLEACRFTPSEPPPSGSIARHGPMYRDAHVGIAALVEANALRSGAPGASHRRLRRLARRAVGLVPIRPTVTLRALAYGHDAAGRPEAAIATLREARERAAALGQPIDAAVATYQLGLRLGGDQGAELRAEAEAAVRAAGSGPAILHEDVGLRTATPPDTPRSED